jgi:hypothetical protein
MGYDDSKSKFSLPFGSSQRHARRAVRANDLAKVARFPIFTKGLFRQKIAEAREAPASRAEVA